NRHRADLLRTEKAVGKGGRIEQKEQHPLFATDAQRTKTIGQPIGPVSDLGIRNRLIATENRRPSTAAFANVAIDQVVGDVKRIRNGNDRSRWRGALDRRGHAPSLELAFASPAPDLSHVVAVAAHGLAPLLSRLACFRTRKLVSGALLICSPAALGGDRPLTLAGHPGETAAITGCAPCAARPGPRP